MKLFAFSMFGMDDFRLLPRGRFTVPIFFILPFGPSKKRISTAIPKPFPRVRHTSFNFPTLGLFAITGIKEI
ncbi:hypothetical protein Aconfl_18940 [Algoriphagus confluentis]|uniref:Uncharacterized protein n=1 Tax=Algoriphagus confluentis TaxID=1697556 RepID=A0ABQ6PNK5_9BACT|nr:hypothetical protein Aconfl_18940 [Algoriphagus confluentis]